MTNSNGKDKIDKQFVKNGAENITDKDVEEVAANAEKIEDKFKSSGPLGRYIENARLMLSLIRDYWQGDYRKILWFTISAMVFVLLYVLNPLDLVPDFIPFIGLVDDVLVFSIMLRLVEKDLKRYKLWKMQQQEAI